MATISKIDLTEGEDFPMTSENGRPLQPTQPVTEKRRPAHEVRLGRVKATVWANHHAEQGIWYSVLITRLYKDDQGQWQSAAAYGRDDLLLVAKVADLAHTWIFQMHQQTQAPDQHGLGEAADVPF
jgi:hypothetical protein